MVSSKLKDIPASDVREAILECGARALADLPTPTIAVILPLLAELRERRYTPTLWKFIDRWRLLARYAELRQDPANQDTSDARLLQQVSREAPSLTPQLGTVCERSLRLWLNAWNATQENGLAGGLAALVRVSGRRRKPASK